MNEEITSFPPPAENPQVAPSLPEEVDSLARRKKKILIILISIVLFVIIIAALFVFINQKRASVIKQPIITPTPTQVISKEQNITLLKNKKTAVPGSEIFLTFMNFKEPSNTCIDCLTEVTLQIAKNLEIKELTFDCGGITGECTKNLTVFGYFFNINKTSKEEIEVKVNK
jgi:hypothetical protein